ncbi:winged helix-turn-helix domain-containing protein [Haloprofundus halophilus]|uniref:winged helix-turn-helix domain-containing protein n=1 Tax=Haloprofundus halophilus TaxID=2283527 RepID=UPI000E42F0AD|nr:winged helix-turn-helix domain-containing protein [Haloprofundus halophilus]
MAEDRPSKNDRDNSGKFSEQYDPDEFVDALRQLGGDGSTKEVADKVGCSRRTATYRLSSLRDDGRIGGREIGRSMLWMVNDGE